MPVTARSEESNLQDGRCFPHFVLKFSGQTTLQVKQDSVTSGGSDSEQKHCMIVDDNPGILDVVATMTNVLIGAEARTFVDPREALSAILANPTEFNFIITDLEMPGMNGLELRNAIRAAVPGLKVILMTGNHTAIDPASAELFGFAGLIYKPFAPDQLLHCIQSSGALEAGKPSPDLACSAVRI